MRTWYVGHDEAYKKRKAAGQCGWSTQESYGESQTHMQRLLDVAAVPVGASLLECGCGAGNMSIWYALRGFRVSGIDIAPTAIAWAQENAQAADVLVDFRVGDVCHLTAYADAVFDVVVDGSCLHCIIGDDRGCYLSSVVRVLKPGGVFLSRTMCGTVRGDMCAHFDPISRCLVYGEILARYIGLPGAILAEMQQSGLVITHSDHRPDTNGADDLFVVAKRPASSRRVC